MRDAARVLVFVSMLSTSTCARIPLDFEVTFIELDHLSLLFFKDSNCDSARMNSTFSFGGRDSLNAMSAWLVIQVCKIVADNLNGDFTLASIQQPVLSANAGEVLHVSCGQISCKEFGIFSAFCGAYFDDAFHHWLLNMEVPLNQSVVLLQDLSTA
jgi:hypothetical protein